MSTRPSTRYEQFKTFRESLNDRILGSDDARGTHPDGTRKAGATLVTKRFFGLDAKAYDEGALPAKTKEMLGLAASMVLRCDDCIAYHIERCIELGVRDEELFEVFDIALIVGGSIVIPHLRRAVEFLDECRARKAAE